MPQLYPCSISSTQPFGGGGGGSPVPTRNMYALSPAADGVTTDFTIVGGTPSGTYVDCFVGGIFQTPVTNYVFTPSNPSPIHFTTAPAVSDILEVAF